MKIDASTDRYVEVKCATCGYLHLIAPRERDHPCEAVAPCSGKVSDPEDRTFECVPQGFKARTAALLRKIEKGSEDASSPAYVGLCPSCFQCVYDLGHAPDCALAALLREASA